MVRADKCKGVLLQVLEQFDVKYRREFCSSANPCLPKLFNH